MLETALYVDDLDTSQSFYEKLFGWEVMLRDERMAALAVPGRQVLILFHSGSTLEPAPTPVGIIPPHGSIGRQHVCFAIELHELEAWKQRLGEFGVAIESSLTWPQGATSVYFRDPDGHSLELSTPRLWPNDPGTA